MEIDIASTQGSVLEVVLPGHGGAHRRLDLAGRQRYVADSAADEDLARAVMEFLLEREPLASILPAFSLDDVRRYFPEFPRAIAELLGPPPAS